ncbi:ABC transporter substrate-binding protein [Serratia odorifera]|uniref:ABC transporter, substrate-binding protein, family 5 n=2 Tax=Serratia odorifera TaxID=618 RepID=D4E7Z5_SEROD|nr:ABC transporter substrate-binding protein [Serratia odorifera]EFE94200.1 ABC transporter, substrate-binding protein, family 5 [Serratia odorifera DSM 4582]PNK88947.1 ABC transporter substrate-binding protein [Serratia odorifera]RII70025.1 ABC transporter substrate-binding protein [Serratia odorifera]VDZ64533.1 Hemin-binding lipoprotein [Serratia odorifera]HEJ9095017.1 ABC transporter substrate-binding protein [Serratia odorifera]
MKAFAPTLMFLAMAGSFNLQAATPANTLVIAQSIDDAISFDPAQGFELTTVQALNSLYQRLLQSDPRNPVDLKPTLAEKWQAGSDNRSLTFTLRPEAKFSSGNPLRPEDVIFSLSRVVKLNLEPSFILTQLGWNGQNVDQFLSKVDERTVKISWRAEVSPAFVLSLLSAPVSSIVDARQVQAHQQGNDLGNQWLSSHSAGSGPYQLRTYVPHEVVVLEANPGSPEGAPKLKTVLIKNVPDAAARRLLIEQGDADIARNLGADQMAALKDKPGVKPLAIPYASLYFLQFNAKASPALGNPAFWEAARWLFDYQGIADDLLKGQFQNHQAFLPDGYLGALQQRPYRFDPQRAKQILAKAGLNNVSFKLDVNNQPPYLDIAQALQASFAQGGVKVELVPGISSQVSTKVKSLNYDATLTSWGPDYFDPNTNAAAFAYNPQDGSKTLAWRANWHIPALNALTLAATAENDTAKRVADYQQLQRQVQQSSPFVIGLQARSLIAVRDNLKGYVQGINPDMVFYSQVTK